MQSALGRPYLFKFFKGCLLQILLDPFLNTLLSHIILKWIAKYYEQIFQDAQFCWVCNITQLLTFRQILLWIERLQSICSFTQFQLLILLSFEKIEKKNVSSNSCFESNHAAPNFLLLSQIASLRRNNLLHTPAPGCKV